MSTFFVINGILLVIALLLLLAERFLVTYGECELTLNGEKTFSVMGGDSLLNYLNTQKVFIPSACGGKATCGFCKVKVLSGGGSILPTEEVYVTKKEMEEGVRLACQVKVKKDVEIFIPEYLLGAEEFGAAVTDLVEVTHDIKLVRLAILKKTINFKPGQYIQFEIPGTDEYRAYSVASSPEDKKSLDLVIRLVPGGLCSAYVHKVLAVGDKAVFTEPFGDFYLREESTKDIVAIAGGCGMAPIRSILYYLAARGMPRKFYYFFGARGTQDLYFTEELRELEKKFPNFKYIPALSEPTPQDKWEGEVGLITQVAEKYLDEKSEKEAYLCGPPPMIDAAIKVLTRKGIDTENIFFDKF
ncbi:MAG: NADH:ubiquinone reductase (Na(+)-transporting) subunit F [Candidatus Omnitrophota bacterium]